MSAAAERLHLLHEHIRLSLLERKRALASGAEPSSRSVHEISRSLDTLARGIEQLEREQRRLRDDAGELTPQELRERQDELNKLQSEYGELQAQFLSQNAQQSSDDGVLLIDLGPRSGNSLDESAAREALIGPRDSPNGMRKSSKTVRFRDSLVETEEMDNQQVFQLHQSVMEEQDESLGRLSASIRNQRELSIQIGEELDSHVRLLDDVDVLVDRHQTRLDSAKRRLNRVARTAKDHGSLVVIIILIIILVLLIAILK